MKWMDSIQSSIDYQQALIMHRDQDRASSASTPMFPKSDSSVLLSVPEQTLTAAAQAGNDASTSVSQATVDSATTSTVAAAPTSSQPILIRQPDNSAGASSNSNPSASIPVADM
jgi:hypothetical protein